LEKNLSGALRDCNQDPWCPLFSATHPTRSRRSVRSRPRTYQRSTRLGASDLQQPPHRTSWLGGGGGVPKRDIQSVAAGRRALQRQANEPLQAQGACPMALPGAAPVIGCERGPCGARRAPPTACVEETTAKPAGVPMPAAKRVDSAKEGVTRTGRPRWGGRWLGDAGAPTGVAHSGRNAARKGVHVRLRSAAVSAAEWARRQESG